MKNLLTKIKEAGIKTENASKDNWQYANYLAKQYDEETAVRYLTLVCHADYLHKKDLTFVVANKAIDSSPNKIGRPNRSFTKEEIADIENRLANGESHCTIRKSYGCSNGAIFKIRKEAIESGKIHVETYKRGKKKYLRATNKPAIIKKFILENSDSTFTAICKGTHSSPQTVKKIWLTMVENGDLRNLLKKSNNKVFHYRKLTKVEKTWAIEMLQEGHKASSVSFALKVHHRVIEKINLTK